MQTDCNAEQFVFEALGRPQVTASFDGGAITSNAGALLLRETDRRPPPVPSSRPVHWRTRCHA
jgi:hypothetical protein